MLTLAYGRTGQRIWCPHRGEAVPSASVTVTIYDDSGEVVATATTATKGGLSTTLAAAVVQGARSITLTATSGVSRDDPIAIVGDDMQAEILTAIGVDSTAKSISLDHPLERSYSAGDTVKSAAVYYDLDASETDTWTARSYYQAVFESTSWSAVRTVVFRILDGALENPITMDDVLRVLPAAAVYRGADTRAELDQHRDMAWRIIERRLLAAGRDVATLRDASAFAEAGGILAAALLMATRPGGVEAARILAGEPLGSGGLFASHWDSVTAVPTWWDSDLDRERLASEMANARRVTRRGR